MNRPKTSDIIDRLKILDIIDVANEINKYYGLGENLELLKISSIYDLYNNMPFFKDEDFKLDNIGEIREKVLEYYDVPREIAMRFNMDILIKMCAPIKRNNIKVVPEAGLKLRYADFTKKRAELIDNRMIREKNNLFLHEFVALHNRFVERQKLPPLLFPNSPGAPSVAPSPGAPSVASPSLQWPTHGVTPGKKGHLGYFAGGKRSRSRNKRTHKKYKTKKHV